MKKIFIFLIISIFMISFTSAALNDNLASYYKLDDSSGTIIDSTGLNNATYNGALYSQAGKINTSIGFDGGDDTIDTAITILPTTQSINFWFKRGTKTSEDRILASKWGSGSGRWAIRLESGTFDLQAYVGSDATWRDILTISDTDWHMITLIITSTEYSVYLDNVLQIDSQSSTYTNDVTGTVFFGAFDIPSRYFEGELDEAGIWNRTLSLSEVTQIYNGGAGLTYPFEEVVNIVVNLTSPSNDSLISVTDISFIANMTSGIGNFTNATYFIWYENGTIFNQTTVALPNSNDTTYTLEISDFDFDNYKWNVYACVSSGNCSFAENNYTFIVSPFSVDAVTYNESVLETSSQTFIINISAISTVSSVTGFFWYNGSSYTAVITNPNSGEYSAKSILDIPLQDNVGNKSFHWQFDFTLTGFPDKQQNTSEYSHEVNTTFIELCNTTYSSNIINFTTRNAENPFPKINGTFKSAWQWWIGNGDVMRNRSYEDVNDNKSDFDFCGSVDNISYIFNVDIEADAISFAKNFYYFTDAPIISGSETSTDLYLLNDSLATPTTLLVRDRYQRVIEDVLIYVQLYDVGTDSYYTTTMGKTNQNGEDIVYLNWFDSLYKFILIQNGTTILTTEAYKVGETPQIFQIEEDIVYDLDKFDDFEYSLTFNNLTNNFVLTYIKPNGLVESGCLRVINRDSTSDTIICEVCSTSVSATLYCDISTSGNGTFIATFYATGSLAVIEWITYEVGIGISETIYNLLDKDDAAFYTILTSIIVLGVFLINPVFGVMAIIGGLLLSSTLGFALISYLTFLFITCVGGIIIWILRR